MKWITRNTREATNQTRKAATKRRRAAKASIASRHLGGLERHAREKRERPGQIVETAHRFAHGVALAAPGEANDWHLLDRHLLHLAINDAPLGVVESGPPDVD